MGKTLKRYVVEYENDSGKAEFRTVCEVPENMRYWEIKHIRSVETQSFFHDNKAKRFEERLVTECIRLSDTMRINGIIFNAGKGSDNIWYISKINRNVPFWLNVDAAMIDTQQKGG